MSNLEQATQAIIEATKKVVNEMRFHYPTWERAFVRFEIDDSISEVRSSYVASDGIHLLDTIRHKHFFETCHALGKVIRHCAGSPEKPFLVMLLDVGADLNYEMHYEYEDRGRWLDAAALPIKRSFKDTYINFAERFSIGLESHSGRFYLSIPVSNGMVDYEEYYEISKESHDLHLQNPAELSEFAKKC